MTDTARTLAEVKALLADNSGRNISAQDMRDVVESLANPIVDGGMEHPIQHFISYRLRDVGTQLEGMYSVYDSVVDDLTVVPHAGAWLKWKLDAQVGDNPGGGFEDPNGWLVSEQWDDEYWGVVDPPHTLVELPPGFYTYYLGLSTDAPVDSDIVLRMDAAEQPPDQPTSRLYPWGGVDTRDVATAQNARVAVGQIIVVGQPMKFSPIGYYRHATTDAHIHYLYVLITRVGGT
jgi:hypothetical protein